MADGSPKTLPISTQTACFPSLYREHAGMVRRALRQLGVAPAQLDDATQDVFVVLHRRLDDFDRDRSVKNWLWGIARGVASGYRRSASRRQRLHGALPVAPTLTRSSDRAGDRFVEGPERSLARQQADAILDDFLGSLDADKCAVFVLSELEGRRGPEIAQLLDVNLNTVYARLRAARQRFDAAVARHREPRSRPLFAAWLPLGGFQGWWQSWTSWSLTGSLAKPVAVLSLGTVAALAVQPTAPAEPSAPAPVVVASTHTDQAPAAIDQDAIASVTPTRAATRFPRTAIVPEPLAPPLDDATQVTVTVPPVVPTEAAPSHARRPSPALPAPTVDAAHETSGATTHEPLAVPAHVPWSTRITGDRPVRHPSLLSLRQDFIDELLRVALQI